MKYIRSLPVAERTTPTALDFMQLGEGLAGLLPPAEAKAALAADARGVPYLIVRGRLGGSAMTAAAVNALARSGL